MEYQQKILLIVGILIVVAVYFAITSAPAVKTPQNTTVAEALLLKSASFGKGIGDYTYAYTEISDGYKTTYDIWKNGNDRELEIENPLSTKRVFLLRNDTILCIKYPVNETCESVAGNPDLDNYVAFVQSKFYNDTIIDQSGSSLQYLLAKGYLRLDSTVTPQTVSGNKCSQISYVIDYGNLSLDEAARFSIGSNSPRLFYLTSCIDNQTGLSYLNTLQYADQQGKNHSMEIRVSAFSKGSSPIVPPSDINGSAVAVLTKERAEQIVLASCFTDKTGADQQTCIADEAINIHRKDLCDYTGSRRDRCLVSLVPLTKDQTICPAITDPGFKDDCYIELAGAYKDSSYCSNVMNQSKTDQCQNAAKPLPPVNQTVNTTALVNIVEKSGNSTGNMTNSSGNTSWNNQTNKAS